MVCYRDLQRKDASAKQPEGDLDVNYRTACYLSHHIRQAMAKGQYVRHIQGVVKVDETYIAGAFDKRRKRARREKPGVMGIREGGGEVRAFHVERITSVAGDQNCNSQHLNQRGTGLHRSKPAVSLVEKLRGDNHDIVHHTSKEYVRGDVAIQVFYGYLVVGTYHAFTRRLLRTYAVCLNVALHSPGC
jgi:transposase